MRNILLQYWRVGAAALVVVGIVLLGLSGYLTPLVQRVIDPVVGVQTWLATRYLAVYELVSSPGDVNQLRTENQQMRNEIARLQSQIAQLQEQQKDDEILYALLNVARTRPDSDYVAAMVIGRDPNPFMRYVLIDAGSDLGLKRGMPVITSEGLVGRIDAVTSNAARVELITDPNAKVNVRLRDVDTEAMLYGSVTGDITIEMISQEVTVQPGELVLTSGLGGSYPSNIVVGQVTGVRRIQTALFQSANVQPAVDFTNLRAVLVITGFRAINTAPLEESIEP